MKKPEPIDLALMSIEQAKPYVGTHPRLQNALKKEGLGGAPIGVLCLYSRREFLEIPNVSWHTFDRIYKEISDNQMYFGGDADLLEQFKGKTYEEQRKLLKNAIESNPRGFFIPPYADSLESQQQMIVVSIDIKNEFQRKAFIDNFKKGKELNDGSVVDSSAHQIAFNALGMMVYNQEMMSEAHDRTSVIKIRETHDGVEIILTPTRLP